MAVLATVSREPGQALTGAAISGVALCEDRRRRARDVDRLTGRCLPGHVSAAEERRRRPRRDIPLLVATAMTDARERPDPAADQAYVVVARRYRPLGFDQLVGQEHVGRALKNAIETNRVGHAYLFTGARGVGKTSTARIFAKALNDPSGPTPDPDSESDVAQAIDAGEDVDVIEIDGASNRGIDEIRSLRANVGVRPSRSRFKIYIIDEVHMLTAPAFNALLKTLEEPPEHVKFIFCTTDPEKIPITVLSRCQRFDFAPVEVSKIVGRLREIVTSEQAEAEDAALELIARRAAGSMRDSQSLLEQVLSFSDGLLTPDSVHAMLGTADDERLHAMAQAMARRDAAEALTLLDAAIDAGVDAGRLAEQLLGYFRDVMATTVGCDANLLRHSSAAMYDEIGKLGNSWGLQTVLAVVALVDQTLVRIRHSVHARVLLEATLIQICSLPDLQQIADLASASVTVGGPSPNEKKKRRSSVSATDATDAAADPASGLTESLPNGSVQPQQTTDAAKGGNAPSVSRAENRSETKRGGDEAPGESEPGPAVSRVGAENLAEPTGSTSVADAYVSTEKSVEKSVSGGLASERSAVAVAEPVTTWDQAAAERLWAEALGQFESMTQSIARVVSRVSAVGGHELRLIFPADGALAMRRCENPDHRSSLTEVVSRVAGRPMTLQFELTPPRAAARRFLDGVDCQSLPPASDEGDRIESDGQCVC